MSRIVALFVTVALLTPACGGADEGAHPSPPVASAVPPPDLSQRVRFEPVVEAELMTLVSLPAEVTLPSGAIQHVAPPFAGRLSEWSVRLGDRVEAGAPLARVDSPELTDLATRERELSAVVRARRKVVSDQRAHMSAGLSTAQELQVLQLGLREAQAGLTAVREQIAARRALGAGGEEAGGDAEGWVWRTPGAGVVQSIDCPAGAVVSPDQRCLTLLDTARANLLVRVPERYLGELTGEVRVSYAPASRPMSRHTLTLARRDAVLDPLSRTRAHYFAPVEGDEQAIASLIPGASGRVDLLCDAPPDARAVPAGAVTRLGGGDAVFVAEGDDPRQARPVPVVVVGRQGDRLLVRGELGPDARVAVTGVFLLKSLRALGEE